MKDGIEKLLIARDITIKEAMKRMGEAAEKILFVTDNEGRLVGSLTDGDIRGWILADKVITESVENVFNKKPISVKENCHVDTVKELMLGKKLEWIPALDNSGKIKDVYLWEEVFGDGRKKGKKKLDMPVVIMAGGMGSRLDPFMHIFPKPLIPVGKKPVVEFIMDNFYENGFKKFYLILDDKDRNEDSLYKGKMIEAYFRKTDHLPYKFNYIYESTPLGTAGGLRLVLSYPDFKRVKTFFVSNCDIIVKADYSDIYDFHIRNKNQVTIVGSMKHFKIPYGVIGLNGKGELKQLTEKPEYDFLVNTGMYVIEKRIIELIKENEAIHFTNLIDLARKSNCKVGVYPVSERSWTDIGQWEGYWENVKKMSGQKG